MEGPAKFSQDELQAMFSEIKHQPLHNPRFAAHLEELKSVGCGAVLDETPPQQIPRELWESYMGEWVADSF